MIAAIVGGLVMLALLFLDQILKAWAYAVEVSQPGFFLGFIRMNFLPGGNTGIAWGLFGDSKTGMILITILTVVMIAAIAALYFTVFKKNTAAKICLAVVEAGALGNLIDRVCLGYVRDFVDVSPIGFNICNFADFYITFGAIALLVVILFVGKEAVIPLGRLRKRTGEESEEKETGPKENGD